MPSGGYQAHLEAIGDGEYHLTVSSGLTGQVALSQQGKVKKGEGVVVEEEGSRAVAAVQGRPSGMAGNKEAAPGVKASTKATPDVKCGAGVGGVPVAWIIGVVAVAVGALPTERLLLWRRTQSGYKT